MHSHSGDTWLKSCLTQSEYVSQELKLPTISHDAREHLVNVYQSLFDKIRVSECGLPFSEYMQHVLYAPGIGYYSAGSQKFGASGDFITAPESSALFGRLLGNQLAAIFSASSIDTMLEIGPGTGRLAVDILTKLAELDALPRTYFMLEVSADLRLRQEALLKQHVPELLSRVQWLNALPASPMNAIVIANEVVDALPVERVTINAGEVLQHYVQMTPDGLAVSGREPDDTLYSAVVEQLTEERISTLTHYTTEVRTNDAKWLASILDCLDQGVLFLIDYGYSDAEYYQPDRDQGSLMCYFQHRKHDNAVILPGLQDITASANFSLLSTAARESGAELTGFTSQGNFLLGCGAEQEFSRMTDVASIEYIKMAQELKQLVMPDMMGEVFQVMALSKHIDVHIEAFQFKDLSYRL